MIKRNNVPGSIWTNPVHFLAFGLGSGSAPCAPGTFGTAAAIPVYLLLVHFLAWPVYAIVVVVMFVFGVWLCDRTERDIGVHDHSGIVWDEIVGFLLTMTALPRSGLWVIAGFCLFRLFDIWKPWPVRQADRHIKGGLGIMLDDILAALYALLVLHIARILTV